MKKTRLLEIIREEIAGALNEIGQSPEEMNATKLSIDAAKAKIAAAQKELQQLQKTGVSEAEDLNEEPDFAGAGGRFDKQVAAKYGEEDTLEAATEKVTNRVLSDKGITKADVAKMDAKELTALLKDIRAFISQKKQTPEVAAALKKQEEFDDSGSQLQDNQTNKAILRVLGFGSKKGPKGPTKPKAEKPAKEKAPNAEKTPKTKVATRTKGDDGFDTVSYVDKEEAKAAAAAEKADKALGGKYAANLSPEDESQYKEYKSDITSLVNDLENNKNDKLKMKELKLYLEDSEVRRLFKAKGVKLSDLVRSVIK